MGFDTVCNIRIYLIVADTIIMRNMTQFKTIDILHNFKNPITAYGLIGENLLKLCNIQQSYSFTVKTKQKKYMSR